jgi:hypothetical protein
MEATTQYDDRDARAKAGRSLVKMKVRNERTLNLGLGENNRIDLGEYEITVWESEVKSIQAMVETDLEGIEAARRSFEVAVAKQALDAFKDNDPLKLLGEEELRERVREGKTPALVKAYENALKLTGFSVQGEFRRMKGRDIKPLSEAKVMDSGIPSPYQLQEIAHAKLIGAIMNAGKK